jgi:UDP-GlcNAc:undecaprenyl-phosphate GlcNAc-1-phosphate transferase
MEYLWVIAAAALVTAIASWAVLKFAHRLGLVSQPRERDVHRKPTPRLGGVAMYVGLLVGMVGALFLPKFQILLAQPLQITAVLGACTLIAVIGFLDDLFDLDWMVKLGAQLAAAGLLAWAGIQILSLPVGHTLIVASPTVNFLLTVFLMGLVMNAVNFIDGLDGLVAGVAIIANSIFFVYTQLLTQQSGESRAVTLAGLLAAVVIGICIGFLPFNWHRAHMFMGDTGALLVGLLMATSTVSVTGQLNPAALDQKLVLASYIPIILPMAVLAMPLMDFTLAVFRRVRAGKSPFTADRKHLHHRLLDYGHSHLQVVFIFYLWTVVISTVCLLVFLLQSYAVPIIVLVAGSLLCLLVTLVPLSRLRDAAAQRGLVQLRASSTAEPEPDLPARSQQEMNDET